jgi:Flp pilus assembly protein TadG
MENVTRRKSQRGNAMIEFALSWAILSLMFTGIFQYGWSMFVYNKLMTSVANGALMGSRANYDDANGNSRAAFTTNIQNMVLYGSPIAGTTTVVPGLTAGNVDVNLNLSGGFPTDITVSIKDFTINAVFGSMQLTNKPRVTYRYSGQVICTGC